MFVQLNNSSNMAAFVFSDVCLSDCSSRQCKLKNHFNICSGIFVQKNIFTYLRNIIYNIIYSLEQDSHHIFMQMLFIIDVQVISMIECTQIIIDTQVGHQCTYIQFTQKSFYFRLHEQDLQKRNQWIFISTQAHIAHPLISIIIKANA